MFAIGDMMAGSGVLDEGALTAARTVKFKPDENPQYRLRMR